MSEQEKHTSFLTPEQQRQLKAEIEAKKELLEANQEFGVGEYKTAEIEGVSIDKNKIREQIKQLEKQLEEYSPQRITDPVQRDKIMRRRKELEKDIIPYLETRKELGIISRDDPDWMTAYKKAEARLRNENGIEDKIREWKKLGQMLEPDDPFISDLDTIRKNR